ncbi:TldD/PmbA family protein [Kaarinaea lacus]
MNIEQIVKDFKAVVPQVDFWSLRLVSDNAQTIHMRQNRLLPPKLEQSLGAHITLMDGNGAAYAATCQLDQDGFRKALQEAMTWAEVTSQYPIMSVHDVPRPTQSGSYETRVEIPWDATTLSDKINTLAQVNQALKIHDAIVDWQAYLSCRDTQVYIITSDGVEISQRFHYIFPGMDAVANKGSETQRRTGGGWGSARQGGLEQLAALDFPGASISVAEEALALLDAPECPSGNMSLLLMPNQMMLQIHESIGHPLELDRILGDERNYAGTSFVTTDMCGSYQYGSDLLNVTFDPSLTEEMASYGFDDEGTPAERTYIIRNGILERLLGSGISQARAGLPGVANARASDWNRPPIDRMANLNLEPGNKTLQELITSIENGVLMDTNLSWSIDDSRNKFQFGCEIGKLIKDGEVTGIVKNPNYRGISATFWRNLTAVGDSSTFEVWGTPYCGKGEPNQMIHVGHASPACVFSNVDVFGGE